MVLTEAGAGLLRDSERDSALVTDTLLTPLDPAERATLHALLLRVAEPGGG